MDMAIALDLAGRDRAEGYNLFLQDVFRRHRVSRHLHPLPFPVSGSSLYLKSISNTECIRLIKISRASIHQDGSHSSTVKTCANHSFGSKFKPKFSSFKASGGIFSSTSSSSLQSPFLGYQDGTAFLQIFSAQCCIDHLPKCNSCIICSASAA